MRLTRSLFPLMCATGLASAATLSYPSSPKESVTDIYFGIEVPDPYRWLEQTDSSQVKSWISAQNELTRSVLDQLPTRQKIKEEMLTMIGGDRVSRSGFEFRGGKLFALKRQPPKNQSMVVVLNSDLSVKSERIILDANELDPTGKTAIDWFVPSHNGTLVAISLSKNGSEEGTLYVYDTLSGQPLSDVVPRVQYPTGGGSVAFSKDGTGLFYTRYPQGNERPKEDMNFFMQVYYHKLGTSADQDAYVFGKDLPRIAEIKLITSEDGEHILADVANGDGGEHGFFLRNKKGKWNRIADFTDGFRNAAFGLDGRLYALGLKDSPRGRIVAMKLSDKGGLTKAQTIVEQSEGVIEDFVPTKSQLYVNYMIGGPSELWIFGLDGKKQKTLGAEPIASTTIGTRLKNDAILFGSQSYIKAFAWYAYNPNRKSPKPRKTELTDPPIFAVDGGIAGVKVVREFATSKDGTKVPVNIITKEGVKLDGSNPVLLTGYGGYGISLRPAFSRRTVFWLHHGGVFAVANLRGGGEYGEDWHLAGNLANKQNVFDDFIASAQLLFSKAYTKPNRLAIEGRSNGGLLMTAVTVQRPDLFRAVASHVGVQDMLRVELTSNGAFNVTEFGTVKNQEHFKALYAYSPLHNVKDGTNYPAMLFTTGEHDGRVDPWMSYKITARMQAANPNGKPILLRVAADAGHGMGTSLASAIEEDADVFSFLFEQLGMH